MANHYPGGLFASSRQLYTSQDQLSSSSSVESSRSQYISKSQSHNRTRAVMNDSDKTIYNCLGSNSSPAGKVRSAATSILAQYGLYMLALSTNGVAVKQSCMSLQLTYLEFNLNRGWQKRGVMWKTGPNPAWYSSWRKRVFVLKGKNESKPLIFEWHA